MRRASPLLSVLFLLGVLVGCQPQSAPPPMKFRPREYKRIVSLSPGTTEILAANFSVQNIVGRTSSCNFPTFATDKIPVVATVKPDWEKLRAARPDFIAYDAVLYSPQDVAKMKETGATLFGFTAKTVDEFQVQVFELANFVGSAARASDYVDKIQLERANATGTAPEPRQKVAVIMPGANGQHMILGKDSFLADVVRNAGGEPVGPAADRFVPLTPEALVSLNPDLIVVPAKDAKDAAGARLVANDPRFKNVKAVRDGRIRAMIGDVLLRMGSRVDTCIKGIYRLISSN
ncbi:MAG: ABC transporter substrate-binding protein [Fimbriimonas sp.]